MPYINKKICSLSNNIGQIGQCPILKGPADRDGSYSGKIKLNWIFPVGSPILLIKIQFNLISPE